MSETVYIARLKEVGFYKIGVTKRLKSRIMALSACLPFDLELVHIIVSDEARDIERGLHDYLKDFRIKGEWFDLPDHKIDELKTMKTFPKLPPYYQPIGERRPLKKQPAKNENKDRVKWSIHPIRGTDKDGEGPIYAVLPNDGGQGVRLGRLPDVKATFDQMTRFLTDGLIDNKQPVLIPQDTTWVCIREAEEEYGVPRATLTWACRKGAIVGAEKLGNRWRFPLVTFRAWLRKRKS